MSTPFPPTRNYAHYVELLLARAFGNFCVIGLNIRVAENLSVAKPYKADPPLFVKSEVQTPTRFYFCIFKLKRLVLLCMPIRSLSRFYRNRLLARYAKPLQASNVPQVKSYDPPPPPNHDLPIHSPSTLAPSSYILPPGPHRSLRHNPLPNPRLLDPLCPLPQH